jgi:hypothetical protein
MHREMEKPHIHHRPIFRRSSPPGSVPSFSLVGQEFSPPHFFSRWNAPGPLQVRRVDRFSRYFGSHDLRFQISISKLSEILIRTSHDLDLSDYTIHIFCSLCLTESRKASATLEKIPPRICVNNFLHNKNEY